MYGSDPVLLIPYMVMWVADTICHMPCRVNEKVPFFTSVMVKVQQIVFFKTEVFRQPN